MSINFNDWQPPLLSPALRTPPEHPVLVMGEQVQLSYQKHPTSCSLGATGQLGGGAQVVSTLTGVNGPDQPHLGHWAMGVYLSSAWATSPCLSCIEECWSSVLVIQNLTHGLMSQPDLSSCCTPAKSPGCVSPWSPLLILNCSSIFWA